MGFEQQSTTPVYRWTQGWNDKAFGTYVLMAKLTDEAQFRTDAQRWLDYWSVPAGGGPRTGGGLIIVDPGGWGELRYAANTAFVAFVYADYLGTGNAFYSRYHDFAVRQIDYALGDNPLNRSLVVGFGANPPQFPHHRGAHGTWTNNMNTPVQTRHILYGALVGGPENTSDSSYNDSRDDFVSNEVATDYNAGFTSALARMVQEFGGAPLANFPPPEVRDDNEIYIQASVNASGASFTEIKSYIVNKSSWPARHLDDATFRYFFTLEPGVTPSMLTTTFNHNQCGGSGPGPAPVQWSGNIYSITINCTNTRIYPGGEQFYRSEVQFRIASSGAWDPSNDWSFAGVATTPGATPVTVNNIVLYDNGVRIWGNEPGQPTPTSTQPASTATRTPTATATRTATGVVPSNTPTRTATRTSTSGVPSNTPTRTATRTATGVVASNTPTRTATGVVASNTPTRTNTLAIPTITPTRTNTPVAGGCAVTYTVNDWNNGGGFTGMVTITNSGTTAINGWTLVWTFANQRFDHGWEATISQPGGPGTQVTAVNLSHNAILNPNGGSRSFGFNAAWFGSNPRPAAFTLNGATCSVS
jgi:hypothetical protein